MCFDGTSWVQSATLDVYMSRLSQCQCPEAGSCALGVFQPQITSKQFVGEENTFIYDPNVSLKLENHLQRAALQLLSVIMAHVWLFVAGF